MMQRYACTADFLNERFAACLKYFQIRRAERFFSGSGKDQISHLEIAYRTIVRRRKRIDLFRNAQRRLSRFIVRAYITDKSWINRVAKNDQRVVTEFNRIGGMQKCARDHNKRVGS